MNSFYYGDHEPSASLQEMRAMSDQKRNVNKRLEALAQGNDSGNHGMNYQSFGHQVSSPTSSAMMMTSDMHMQPRNLLMGRNELRGFSNPNMLNNHCKVLLVENLPSDVANLGSVCNIFGTFGIVDDVKIIERKQLVALVQMKSADMANRAVLRQQDYKSISPEMNVNLCTDVEAVLASQCMLSPYTNSPNGLMGSGIQDMPQRHGGRVLLINDMPKQMATPTSVFNLFSLYGEVGKVQIMEKMPSKALVEMSNATHAQNCRRYLNGIEVCGEKISVSTSNKSHLGGHIDDANFQEFNRGRRGDKPCIEPTSTLFVSNFPGDKLEELRRYLVESGFTVHDIQRVGKNGEKALVKLASVEEATLAVITLQDTMPEEIGKMKGRCGLNIMFSPRNQIVSHCFKCNETDHLVKDCPSNNSIKNAGLKLDIPNI